MVWILLVDFDLSLFTRIPYVKHTNCENSRSATKEASILLLSWNNLSIISSKWPISWILFDWPLIVTTFKSTSKTHLLWKFHVLWQRRVSISIYLTNFSFLQVSRGKEQKQLWEEVRKVLKFHKSHRKSSVSESLF